MSVQTQIDRIEQNVANTYAALSALGADMPTEQNSDNLPSTAGTAKAVLYSAQTLTEEQKTQARTNIGAASSGATPDWNADEGEPGYIKNRTHYSIYEDGNGFLPREVIFDQDGSGTFDTGNRAEPGFTEGNLVSVSINGEKYYSVAWVQEGLEEYGVLIGNPSYVGGTEDNGIPFLAMFAGDGRFIFMSQEESLTNTTVMMDMYTNVQEIVKQIPSKYVVTPNWNASEGEPGYIEGRTHYRGVATVMEERTVELELNEGVYVSNSVKFPDELIGMEEMGGEFHGPQEIIVTWNGVTYTSKVDHSLGFPAYGNIGPLGFADTGEPYLLVPFLDTVITFAEGSATLKIDCETNVPLDKKYLPKDVEYKTISSDYSAKVYDVGGMYYEFTGGTDDILLNQGVELDTPLTEEQFLIFYDIANRQSSIVAPNASYEVSLCGRSNAISLDNELICYFYIGYLRVPSGNDRMILNEKYVYLKWDKSLKKATRYVSNNLYAYLQTADYDDPFLKKTEVNSLIDTKLGVIENGSY